MHFRLAMERITNKQAELQKGLEGNQRDSVEANDSLARYEDTTSDELNKRCLVPRGGGEPHALNLMGRRGGLSQNLDLGLQW